MHCPFHGLHNKYSIASQTVEKDLGTWNSVLWGGKLKREIKKEERKKLVWELFEAPGVREKKKKRWQNRAQWNKMFNACWHVEWNGHLRKTKLQRSGDPFRARMWGFSGSLNHLPENLQGSGPQLACWLRRAQRLRNLHIHHFPRDSYTRWGLRAAYIFGLERWKVTPGQPPSVWMAFSSTNDKT